MSLWKPYTADDVPMDLSTTADRNTQHSHSSEFYAPYLLPYGIAPVEQISPGGSSGYESVQFNPTVPQLVMMTYPVRPIEDSARRPHHMSDADTLSDDPDFQEFERNALEVMAVRNGGVLLSNHPRMRRQVHSASANSGADDAYRRQRERNNVAAKQSRHRRKLREHHSALKVDYLKKEVSALQAALRRNACVLCRQQCL